jgi:hypothetical protein
MRADTSQNEEDCCRLGGVMNGSWLKMRMSPMLYRRPKKGCSVQLRRLTGACHLYAWQQLMGKHMIINWPLGTADVVQRRQRCEHWEDQQACTAHEQACWPGKQLPACWPCQESEQLAIHEQGAQKLNHSASR